MTCLWIQYKRNCHYMIELCEKNFPSSCTTSCFDGLGDYLEGQHWNLEKLMGSDFGLNGFLRFPRTSLLELLLPEATLDSRSSLLPTLLRKPRNSVPNREGRLCVISQCVLSFWSLFLVSHVFSTLHVCWVVQGSDVPKHAQTWLTFAHVKVSLYWSNLSTHIALQIAPYHIPSCDFISYHDMTLMILNEYTYIYILISHDILILLFCAFNFLAMLQDGLTGSAWGEWTNSFARIREWTHLQAQLQLVDCRRNVETYP